MEKKKVSQRKIKCKHEWQFATSFTLNQSPQFILIVVILFCGKCGETIHKIHRFKLQQTQ